MSALWLNGRLVDPAAPTLAADDRGFTLGDGLFETLRAYGGRPFRLDAHLARLRDGAERVGIPLPAGVEEGVAEALAACGAESAAVRITLTRGPAPPGLRPPSLPRPTLAVAARPYAPHPTEAEAGVRAIVASGRINERAATAGLKQLGYLEQVLAAREAEAAGADDALLLDRAGHLAEGAASNLFLVHRRTLLTPPLSCGVLPGVTRAAVLELAGFLGIPTRETPLAPELLRSAEEALLTASLREIVPLVAVNDRAVGRGEPGPVTRKLQAGYREMVER